jgi:hypothetical protein
VLLFCFKDLFAPLDLGWGWFSLSFQRIHTDSPSHESVPNKPFK